MASHNIILLITVTLSCAAFYFLLLMLRPFEKAIESPKVKIISVLTCFAVFIIGSYFIEKINMSDTLMSAIKGIVLGIWVSIVMYLTNKPKDK